MVGNTDKFSQGLNTLMEALNEKKTEIDAHRDTLSDAEKEVFDKQINLDSVNKSIEEAKKTAEGVKAEMLGHSNKMKGL